jgi:hypothetical protein
VETVNGMSLLLRLGFFLGVHAGMLLGLFLLVE